MWRRAAARASIAALVAVLAAGCALAWNDAPISMVAVDQDETSLIVGYHCHMDSSLEAEETSEEVRLTFRTYDEPRGDCADFERVELDEPLGQRRLIDTSTGDELTPCRPDPFESLDGC
jgi:hypothetical protein